MEIEWKSEKDPPYLFRQAAEWSGIKVHRARVLPGRMLEHAADSHEINVAVAGQLVTQRIAAGERLVTLRGGAVIERVAGGLPAYKLRSVKDFIEANLEEDLGLAEIAAVAGLSQFHFARAFRKSTGLTPQQYLMERRIERAKCLLSENDLPIVEISLLTGFKNQSHFTTLFRKVTSLTPKTWRDLKLA